MLAHRRGLRPTLLAGALTVALVLVPAGAAGAATCATFQNELTTAVNGAVITLHQAQVGDTRSVELKLPQSLESTSIEASGGTIELRGRVDKPVLGSRNTVVVKRVLCGQYQTVGQARPNRRGVYVIRFPAPAIAVAALYRAETRVLARPGSKRYVRQFARAVSITLTGQTG